MKRILLGMTALVAVTAYAQAADLAAKPYTKAPLLAPVSNWTGFYVFGGGGYGLVASDQTTTYGDGISIPGERTGGRGYFGTVGGGYDYQFNSSWVAGIFADAQFGDIKGTFDFFNGYANSLVRFKTTYAAGARLGYLIAPNALSYVNAGYTHTSVPGVADLTYYGGGTSHYGSSKLSFDGWFIGGGVENDLNLFGIAAPGWFMKTEYRVAEYGREISAITPVSSGYTASYKPYVQTVSTALIYRFNSGVSSRASAPLYTKAPAAPVNWTGFYLSGGGGYGLWTSDAHTQRSGYITQRMGGRGWFGTVGGGYDYQFKSSWVAGLFADAQFGDIKGSIDWYPNDYYSGTTSNKTNYAVGARLGYLVAPNVLSYVNAGYSHADFSAANLLTYTNAPSRYSLPKMHFDGWFLGGGVENDLNIFGVSAPGWFMKTEYRVAEYGRKYADYLSGGVVVPDGTGISSKPYVQTVSTSLVYRFNWGAPAKY